MNSNNPATFAISSTGTAPIVYILNGPYFMSMEEAAKKSGISRERIDMAVKAGNISFDKSGNQRKVSLKDVIEYFEAEAKKEALKLQEEEKKALPKKYSGGNHKGKVFNFSYGNSPFGEIPE